MGNTTNNTTITTYTTTTTTNTTTTTTTTTTNTTTTTTTTTTTNTTTTTTTTTMTTTLAEASASGYLTVLSYDDDIDLLCSSNNLQTDGNTVDSLNAAFSAASTLSLSVDMFIDVTCSDDP